MFGSFLRALVG